MVLNILILYTGYLFIYYLFISVKKLHLCKNILKATTEIYGSSYT